MNNPFTHSENVIKGESDIPDSSHPHLVIQVQHEGRNMEYWVSTFENNKQLKMILAEHDINTNSKVLCRCRYKDDADKIAKSLNVR